MPDFLDRTSCQATTRNLGFYKVLISGLLGLPVGRISYFICRKKETNRGKTAAVFRLC